MAGSLLDATPEEMAALRQIAQQRAAGMTDEQIFGGITQAGGYGLLGPALDAAGIASSYNLGRGQLAAGSRDFGYNLMRDPYNVVAANQYYADQGGTPGLTDPTLGNVPASPAGRYQGYIDSLLFPQGESGVAGNAPQQVGQQADPWAALRGYTPEQNRQFVEAFGNGGATDPWAALRGYTPEQNRQFVEAFGGATTYHGGGGGSAGGGGAPGQSAFSIVPAQQRSARQLGAQLPGLQGTGFSGALQGGQIPGLSSLNEAEMGRLTPDQRAQYFGLIGSTGRVSNPEAAYQDYTRRYATKGAGTGGTFR